MGNDDHLVRVCRPNANRGAASRLLEQGGPTHAGCAVRVDQCLEQGIARETVGPVQAGAGNFADCVQPETFSLRGDLYPSALIVRGRDDRDRFLGDVEAEFGGRLVMFGKRSMMARADLWVMSSSTWSSPERFISLSIARATISRRERLERMHALHERFAPEVQQFAALAAYGLADEERLGLGVVQAGGVKLDELHVGDRGPGAISHGHAVTGGDVRVGGVEVNLAAAARGEDDRPRRVGLDCIGFIVQHANADAAVCVTLSKLAGGDQVDREMILEDVDVLIGGNRVE